jgi:hypothetical protein
MPYIDQTDKRWDLTSEEYAQQTRPEIHELMLAVHRSWFIPRPGPMETWFVSTLINDKLPTCKSCDLIHHQNAYGFIRTECAYRPGKCANPGLNQKQLLFSFSYGKQLTKGGV